RAALTRGALVTLANWPIILVEFAIESLYELALVVPIVGGAVMVTVVAGGRGGALFAGGGGAAAAPAVSALRSAAAAVTRFLLALIVVAAGGALVMFLVKAGTLTILIAGERQTESAQPMRLRYDTLQRAHTYGIGLLLEGVRRFGRRAMVLSLWLSAAYGLI